jgi:hypothetical protein
MEMSFGPPEPRVTLFLVQAKQMEFLSLASGNMKGLSRKSRQSKK